MVLRRIIGGRMRNACCLEARPFGLQGEEMRRLLPGILLLALATTLAGCGSTDNTTVTTPTTTTTTATVTETFNGTLNRNGGVTFPFTATAGGTVTVTLTTLTPTSTLVIGLSLGTWTGSACQAVVTNDSATQASTVTGTVSAAAALCARVYDTAANVTAAQPQDFTVTIVHP
jgi:uncharacterized protein YceK